MCLVGDVNVKDCDPGISEPETIIDWAYEESAGAVVAVGDEVLSNPGLILPGVAVLCKEVELLFRLYGISVEFRCLNCIVACFLCSAKRH